jgi:site-specific DNA-methyltransferase (adenine-specific)
MAEQTTADASGEAAVYYPIAKLKPWADNPRDNAENVARVARSISRFGFSAPVVARKADSEIIAGHTRVLAAESLGLAEVPVRFLDISTHDAHALALADNRLNELAPWRTDELLAQLNEIGLPDAEVAGWSSEDLDKLAADLVGSEPDDAGSVDEDEAPEPPADPVTRPGDVWQLGKHRLVCGDCRDALAPLFVGDLATLMVTDPPYGVDYGAKNARLNASDGGSRIETTIEDDDASIDYVFDLWVGAFKASRPLLAAGASYYVTSAAGAFQWHMWKALEESGFPMKHELVWKKNAMVFGGCDYHYQHEPILYGWIKGSHKRVADRSQTSVWEIDRPSSSKLHPTMKPVELYARAMRNSSDRGDIAVEPFAGSGTAYAAAEQVGRVVYGSEISPAYCDVIVERWQNLTGGKATRVQP